MLLCEILSPHPKGMAQIEVAENKLLRMTFELTAGCIKLHNDKLYNLYRSPDITTTTKTR